MSYRRQVLGWLAVVLCGATVGLGLVLPSTEEQEAYSRLIAVHPGLAWASYVAVIAAAVLGVASLATRRARPDHLAAAALEVGAVFTALTLVTGSIWGRPTWGVWWQWDPRLTTSALLMAFLAGTLGLRRSLDPGRGRAVVTAIAALATVGLLPIIHFSVEWWRSLHQQRTLLAPDPTTNADEPFLIAMLVGFLAATVLCAWLVLLRADVAALEEQAEGVELDRAIADRRAEARTAPGVPTEVTSS